MDASEVQPRTDWEDNVDGETVHVLHVGSTHVLLQRPNKVGRFPLADFGPGQRFTRRD